MKITLSEKTVIGDPSFAADSDGQVVIDTVPGSWDISMITEGKRIAKVILCTSQPAEIQDMDVVFIDSGKVGVFDTYKYLSDDTNWYNSLCQLVQATNGCGVVDGGFVVKCDGTCEVGMGFTGDRVSTISLVLNVEQE